MPVYSIFSRESSKMPCLLFVLLIIPLLAAAGEVRGKVITQDGSPLTDAVILHRSSGSQTISDSDGRFLLSLPERAKIVLEIIHPDYLDKMVSFSKREAELPVLIRMTSYIRQREEVVVTAMRYPESTAKVPAAEAVLSKEKMEAEMPQNIARSLVNLPGVSNMGTGGFSLVPNIRGLARRRILLMIDNARITSDRRTGPSASFLSPGDIDRIEVLRSPSSVFYGSDAIGGVINILTRSPSMKKRLQGSLHTSYGTVNQEKGFGINLEGAADKIGFLLSFQGRDAENYHSPQGEVLQSRYSQGSLFGKILHQTGKREIAISFLGARGTDIGKANSDSAEKPTWYPRESENFIQIHWREKDVDRRGGRLNFQAYLNPHFLETQKEKHNPSKTEESYGKTQSTDFGLHLSYGRNLGKVRLNTGADLYGREAAAAVNQTTEFSPDGQQTSFFSENPFTDGKRRDLGLFLSADFSGIERMDLAAGIRLDFIHLEARPGGVGDLSSTNRRAVTGFLGASYRVSDTFTLFGNLSRAYRVPSLSELFYSGITGRGRIIARPDLDPENSLNFDGGIKYFGKKLFVGLYAFNYRISNLIERYLIQPQIYTNGNVDRGSISGYELEIQSSPLSGWTIFGNFYSFTGTSAATDSPLNDIPPPRLYLGSKLWLGHLSFELDGTIQGRKKNPGPAEITIPGCRIVNMKAGYLISYNLKVFAVFSNILNSLYYARPDPDSVFEPGGSVVLGVTFDF
jgi:outer membrane receptor protein involved in Fe transport